MFRQFRNFFFWGWILIFLSACEFLPPSKTGGTLPIGFPTEAISPTPDPSPTPSLSPSPLPSPTGGAPRVSSVSPDWGATSGGSTVQIVGSGFQNGSRVWIGTTECVSVLLHSTGSLSCTTGASVESSVSGDLISVLTPDLQAGSGGSYWYVKTPNVVLSTNLKVWLKADALALSDVASLATWTDASGNANHASQMSESKKPTFRSNQLDGFPIVRFDGSNDLLSIPTTGVSAHFSVFVVAARASIATDMHVVEPDCGSSCEWIFPAGQNLLQWNGTTIVSSSFNTLAFSIIYLERVGSVGLVRINGGNPVSGTVTTAQGSQIIIGRTNVDSSGYFSGDIAEIIIYSTALSNSERQSIEKYLNAKYSLGVL